MKRLIITILVTIAVSFSLKVFFVMPETEESLSFFSRFDYKVFIVIVTVVYMVAYKLVQYLASLKIRESFSRIDIVFMCFVMLFMFIPMSRINQDDINKRENRTNAKYVPFIENGRINFEFGRNFEEWFNDRFHFRDEFLYLNRRINRTINGKTISDKAMVGEENWLFSKQYGATDMFQNDNLFSDKDLERIKENMEAFNEWNKSRGTKFYLLLIPDKESVYGEYYPKNYGKVNQYSRLQQIVQYLRDNTDINVVYPYEELLKEKEKQIVYYKTGTHWNEVGAYIGYKKLFETIKKDFPELEVMYPEKQLVEKTKLHADTDIANILGIDAYNTYPVEDMTTIYFEPKIAMIDREIIDYQDKELGYLYKFKNKNKKKKLNAFFYSDSFFLETLNYSPESFAKMDLIFMGFGKDFTMQGVHGETVQNFDADIFVMTTAERFLQRLLSIKAPEKAEEK